MAWFCSVAADFRGTRKVQPTNASARRERREEADNAEPLRARGEPMELQMDEVYDGTPSCVKTARSTIKV
ncbi:hypothetical protein, partial [Streptomyces sp. NPDC096934]|uniref:hypothetical protein n=1 Tax=Streptomyces sp. NPDC096934 TaxID=3155551 RepID=UPI003325116C